MTISLEAKEIVEQRERKGKDPKTGKFLPGNNFKPPYAHRHNNQDITPALDDIERHFPAADTGAQLAEVWEVAKSTRSAKAMLSVMELVMAYRFGKPVTRALSVNSTLDEFRELFSQGGEEEDDEVIDAEVA